MYNIWLIEKRLMNNNMRYLVEDYSFSESWENFVRISGYEKYLVSDHGRVFNNKTKRYLKPCKNNKGYFYINLCENGSVKPFLIHRLVINNFVENTYDKKCVDHADNDVTNNKLINLRYASHKENQFNRSINKNNTTGFKGITFDKNANKFRAHIAINGKKFHIGLYLTLEEATDARRKKANELFKEFTHSSEKL